MKAFELSLRTRVLFGPGRLQELGALAREYLGSRVLLVSDSGIAASGHLERARAVLASAGREVEVFAGTHCNPTSQDVAACAAVAARFRPDGLVALGGGSSIDTARGCNFVHSGGGSMEDYWGVGKARGTLLPLIAVPTTAGTGSEVQSFALISRVEDHQKMACGDPRAAACVALLDPELTVSQPPRVTALTGLDAFTHALETWVTRGRTPISDLFSQAAAQRIWRSFEVVLERPEDGEARGEMQLAACFAGLAIEHSMLGAAHSLANPLTAHHGFEHGHAVALMLPAVMRYNAEDPGTARRYAALARDLSGDSGAGVETLCQRVSTWLEQAGLPGSLRLAGLPATGHELLAAEAARQWTAQFNPRPVDAEALRQLYTGAYETRNPAPGRA